MQQIRRMTLLVVVFCASCAAAPNAIVENDVMIPMRDGKRLATDIVRPRGDAKSPVVLVRTPYRKGTGMATSALHEGYALVVQDVRGRFGSEGEHYPFIHEANDARDTIEWLAKQPWCDGNVAMHGGSYVGFTQLAAAMSGAPQLKSIMPAVPPSDFDYGTMFFGGALRMELVQGWLIGQAASSQRVQRREVGAEEVARWKKDGAFEKWSRHLPLSEPGPIAVGGAGYAKAWTDTIASWDKPGLWAACSAIQRPQDIMVPVFMKAGFYDIFGQENIDLLLALRKNGGSELSRKHSHLLIGPWTHSIGAATGDMNFTVARAALAMADQQWLSRWLKGQKNSVDEWPAIRAFVMNQDRWIDTETWPPAQAVATKFYFGGEGLSKEKPNGTSPRTFSYDPENPVATMGGNNLTIARGIKDHRKNAARADVLAFVTPPLENDVVVAGPVKARLFVSSDARDTDFTAMLLDVRPDGYQANVLDGIVRMRYRAGREKAQPALESGKVVEAEVNLWSTAYCFKKGHRIAVHVSSSNFPRFDRNLNTAEAPASWSKGVVAKNTVYMEEGRASYIELPVMP